MQVILKRMTFDTFSIVMLIAKIRWNWLKKKRKSETLQPSLSALI